MNRWRKRAAAAYGYSLTRLTLNLYLFTEETLQEIPSRDSTFMRLENHRECLVRLLKEYLGGRDFLDELKLLRQAMLEEMDTIVAFTDAFRTYEYALNRMEYRFTEKKLKETGEDAAFVSQIMGYLTAEKNPAVMNRRIQDVVGQLPVRMTRQKFYSLVRDALSIYEGSDEGSFQQMLYLLRVAGLAQLTKKQRTSYGQLDKLLKEIENTDFTGLEAESYHRLIQITELAGEKLFALSEKVQILQELVNDLYVLALVGEDGPGKQEYEPHALHMIEELCDVLTLNQEEIPFAIQEELSFLEGVQELFLEKYNSLGTVTDQMDGKGELVDKLLSNSTFVSLEEEKQELVDASDVKRDTEKLIEDFDKVFSQVQKPVVRAIMATIMSNLPVFFQSLEEIQTFISGSFSACLDKGEKEICKELLVQLMEMEDYEVV